MQRSFGDAVTGWQNVYTNQITAENPWGSINYVDADAKSRSAFYRVVGTEEAKKAQSPSPSPSLENTVK